jgi:hypothetical protein
MNQVIKKLALEAGGSHYPDVNTKQLIYFTELVVKECLSICQKVHDDFESDGQKYDIDWMQRQIAINICKSQIKQHFGIENV